MQSQPTTNAASSDSRVGRNTGPLPNPEDGAGRTPDRAELERRLEDAYRRIEAGAAKIDEALRRGRRS